jgi:hypothetical protein
VCVQVPTELFIAFSDAVLKRAGPRRKSEVLIRLIRAYVDASHTEDNRAGQGKDEPRPAEAMSGSASLTGERRNG